MKSCIDICLGAEERPTSMQQTAHPTASSIPTAGAWRGVNLGGWLLLEPGTAKSLFVRHADAYGCEARCEWGLMQLLRQKGMLDEIDKHRRTYITKADFQKIKACGLNAVRLPLGYWTVTGPAEEDPYHGPALEFIDRAVQWAGECGLQIVLDLHAAPGGESGEAPCGRLQGDQWNWTNWRFDESLRALDILASRYAACAHVTGIEVCNEPSRTVPTQVLCKFYLQAVCRIRHAGMLESRVAIILPVFQRRKENFAKVWNAFTAGKHKNIVFDFHYYHCFGSQWDGKTLAQQLRAVERHASTLRRLPAVVGEWSLALGRAAREGSVVGAEARALFAKVQLDFYSNASHGWFFWNWNDSHSTEWNFQECYQEGAMFGKCQALPLSHHGLPVWDGHGEDPLERLLNTSQQDPNITVGDTIKLRSHNGRYIIEQPSDSQDPVQYKDRFTIYSDDLATGTRVSDGATVRLRAASGNFLAVDVESGNVKTISTKEAIDDDSSKFIVHVEHDGDLQNRCSAFFQSLATFNVMHMGSDHVCALWEDWGEWQRFVVEKTASHQPKALPAAQTESSISLAATPQRRRARSVSDFSHEALIHTPEKLSKAAAEI
jgi:glucan 1,3-beta-glucosidase